MLRLRNGELVRKRVLLGAAASTVVVVCLGGYAAFAAGSSVPATATDAVITTTASNNLTVAGATLTTIESLTLPAGAWVVQATQTAVNFNATDFFRCVILAGTTGVNGHTASVGGSIPTSTLSELGGVTLKAPTTITVQCSHDANAGAAPYVDGGATLSAHKTSHLVRYTTP